MHQKIVPQNLRDYVTIKQNQEPKEKIPTYANEVEAQKAGIKKGTRVIINGVSGTWE